MPKHALTETKARAVCWMNTAYCKPRVQAGTLAGADCREEMTKLQKMGELLQLDFAASEYLFAQYALNNVLGVYTGNLPPPLMQTLAFLKTDMHRIFECCPIFGHK